MIPIPHEEMSLYHSDHIVDRITMIYMILLLSIDVLYYLFAVLFVRMWYEHVPTNVQILKTIGIHYICYWMIVFDLFVYSRTIHYINIPELNIRNRTQSNLTTYIVFGIVTSCFVGTLSFMTYWKLQYTRQQVVVGYNGTPLPIELFQQQVKVQQQQQQQAEEEEAKQQPTIIVITGANTGIGKETVRILYEILSTTSTLEPNGDESRSDDDDNNKNKNTATPVTNAIILLLCRSEQKGQEAIQDITNSLFPSLSIKKSQNSCQLQVIPCDLCSFTSIRMAVQTILQVASSSDTAGSSSSSNTTNIGSNVPIHTLINNAGVMLSDLSYTKQDHHETSLQANFLGHFLLSSLLLPYISTSIINVTSSTYQLNTKPLLLPLNSNNETSCWNENDIQCRMPCKRQYTLFSQYAITKWCNILHTIYLSKYYSHRIYSASIHPGLVRTDVVRNMPYYLQLPNTIFGFILQTVQKTPNQGAWNTIHVMAIASNWYNSNNTQRTNDCDKDNNKAPDLNNQTSESSHLLSMSKNESTDKELHHQSLSSSSSHLSSTNTNGQYWVNRQPQALRCYPKKIRQQNSRLEEEATVLWNWAMQQVQLTDFEKQTLQKLQQEQPLSPSSLHQSPVRVSHIADTSYNNNNNHKEQTKID